MDTAYVRENTPPPPKQFSVLYKQLLTQLALQCFSGKLPGKSQRLADPERVEVFFNLPSLKLT